MHSTDVASTKRVHASVLPSCSDPGASACSQQQALDRRCIDEASPRACMQFKYML